MLMIALIGAQTNLTTTITTATKLVNVVRSPTPLIVRPTNVVPKVQQQCAIRHCGALRKCMNVTEVSNNTFVFSFSCKKEPFQWICCPRKHCVLNCSEGLCLQAQNVTLYSQNNYVDIQVHDMHLVGNHIVGNPTCSSAGGVCGRSNVCTLRVGLARYRTQQQNNTLTLNTTSNQEKEEEEAVNENTEGLLQTRLQPLKTPHCPPCHRLDCIDSDCSCVLLCKCTQQCKNGMCSKNLRLCQQCFTHKQCPVGNSCDNIVLPGVCVPNSVCTDGKNTVCNRIFQGEHSANQKSGKCCSSMSNCVQQSLHRGVDSVCSTNCNACSNTESGTSVVPQVYCQFGQVQQSNLRLPQCATLQLLAFYQHRFTCSASGKQNVKCLVE